MSKISVVSSKGSTIRTVSSTNNSNSQVRGVLAGVPAITDAVIGQLGLDEIESRLTEIEQSFFQQATTPTIGVSEGDIWYDKTTDELKVYREYPVGSTNYRWETILYKQNETLDGGVGW